MMETLPGDVPEWTLGDRLRKARDHARLKQAELADEIGIARSSIVNYEAGKYEPSRPVLLSWALRCGVDYRWLRSGELPAMAGNRRSGGSNMADSSILCTPMFPAEAELAA